MTLRGGASILARAGLLAALALTATATALAPPVWIAAVGALTAMYATLLAAVTRGARRARLQAAATEHAALHDPVTELPNRVLFHDRVHQAIARAGRDGTGLAVMMLDLDRFKEVNDTLGHHNGDLLLCMLGARLTAAVRASDSVARLGGDEFAVLVDADDALETAARLRAAITERAELAGVGVEPEASVGIALYPHHAADPEELLRRADVAMYASKRAHSGVAIYSEEIETYSLERLELIADLRGAIEAGDIVVHFQPTATLADGRVIGVEALARWEHPERGFLYPDAFIPAAELTGLMRPLTFHVLDVALGQCAEWRAQGHELGVSVNVSTRNLLDLTLPDIVNELLVVHGVPASQLELEITETTIMADPPRVKAVLARLAALGVTLAVDDFGTGYTSLSWLRELPLTTLKIDKSFVLNMQRDEGHAVIVRSTVQLGRSLGLRVIAEGVEERESWDELRALGCDIAQGYLLSRPQPAETLGGWLAAHRVEHALD
jgi:diguanylate cyclase (GGDEF)-like protein